MHHKAGLFLTSCKVLTSLHLKELVQALTSSSRLFFCFTCPIMVFVHKKPQSLIINSKPIYIIICKHTYDLVLVSWHCCRKVPSILFKLKREKRLQARWVNYEPFKISGPYSLKCGPLLFEGGSSESPPRVRACYTQQNNVIDSSIILFVLC